MKRTAVDSADVFVQSTALELGQLCIVEDRTKDSTRIPEAIVTQFNDLPEELQESILHRAFRLNNKTMAVCKCICKSWLNYCLTLTFSASFQSCHHPTEGLYVFRKAVFYADDEHFHRIIRLQASNVFLVVRTHGRKHWGGFSVHFNDEAGRPCSWIQWLSSPQNSSSRDAETFLEDHKYTFSLEARGVRVNFQTNGRVYLGIVKLIVGGVLEDLQEEERERLCAVCVKRGSSTYALDQFKKNDLATDSDHGNRWCGRRLCSFTEPR